MLRYHVCPSSVQQSVSTARVAQLTVPFAVDSSPETASWRSLLHPHVSINSTTQCPVFPGRSQALHHNNKKVHITNRLPTICLWKTTEGTSLKHWNAHRGYFPEYCVGLQIKPVSTTSARARLSSMHREGVFAFHRSRVRTAVCNNEHFVAPDDH